MSEGIRAKFVAAWNSCENPELDSVNPHFHNKYASLKATLKVVRDACNGQGIAYMQRLTYATTNEGIDFNSRELVSYVTDGEEQMDLSRFSLDCPPNPQSFGSNLTYAKRQQAQTDWGITGEPDDDGESAAEHAAQTPQRQANRRPSAASSAQRAPQSTPEERRKKMLAKCAELSAKCIENGVRAGANEEYMVAAFNVESMDQLTDEQLVEFGKHLREIEEQSRGLKEGGRQ